MDAASIFVAGSFVLVITVALTMWYFGKRNLLAVEQQGAQDTAENIRQQYGSLFPSGEFLWGVWLGRANFDQLRLVVRNHKDELIATLYKPVLPTTSDLRYFDYGQVRYGMNPVSPMGLKMAFRQQGHSRILYSSTGKWMTVWIYREESDTELCTIHRGTVFHRYSRITRGGVEIGRIISQDKRDTYSPILCMQPGTLSELEQLIVLQALV